MAETVKCRSRSSLSRLQPPLDMTIAGTLIADAMFAVSAVLQNTGMGRSGMWGNIQKPSRHAKGGG